MASLNIYKCPSHDVRDMHCRCCTYEKNLREMFLAEEQAMRHNHNMGYPISGCYSYLVPEGHPHPPFTGPEASVVYLMLQHPPSG